MNKYEHEQSKGKAQADAVFSIAKMIASQTDDPKVKNQFLLIQCHRSILDRVSAIVRRFPDMDDAHTSETAEYLSCVVGGLDAYMTEHGIPIPAEPADLF